MADEITEELKAKVVEVFKNSRKSMLSSRDVGDALGLDHRTSKKAITELVNAGVLEFTSYGGATFIKLVQDT